jgi:DNA polymerase III gamma/tau subunit
MKNRLISICETEKIPYEETALEMLIQIKKSHFRDILVFMSQVQNLGGITLDMLRDYLDVGAQDSFFEILFQLKDNPSESITLINSLGTKMAPQEIYNGLIQASIDAYKFSKNIRGSLILQNKDLREKLYNRYGDSITSVTSYFIDRATRKIDKDYLISILLLMHDRMVERKTVQVIQRQEMPVQEVKQESPKKEVQKPETSKISYKPLTTLDEKARKKPASINTFDKVSIINNNNTDILTDKEFSLLLQRGI